MLLSDLPCIVTGRQAAMLGAKGRRCAGPSRKARALFGEGHQNRPTRYRGEESTSWKRTAILSPPSSISARRECASNVQLIPVLGDGELLGGLPTRWGGSPMCVRWPAHQRCSGKTASCSPAGNDRKSCSGWYVKYRGSVACMCRYLRARRL